MDFPPYFIDELAGGRIIIGIIASIHVLINHPLAVGAYPLLVFMEWRAHKLKRPDLDRIAYKITFVVFIVTTTVGALTGVGIWISTSLFAPFAIGSLLRVFFWGWFIEWLVFITEVILIMWYFLSWKGANTPEKKRKHIRVGIALAVMSWVTMAIIVAVLGFMMRPGEWTQTQAFIDAVLNPLYLPQLLFRTAFAFMTGAAFVWLATFFFTKSRREPGRVWVVERMSHFVVVSTLATAIFGLWYWQAVPADMQANKAVALLTQQFAQWHDKYQIILGATVISFFLIGMFGIVSGHLVPRVALLIPTVLGIWMLGHFERAREFMRKPWIIGDYMYSNGVLESELAFLQSEGILKHATYVAYREVTPENQVQAGQDVFMISCSRCHGTHGINGVIEKFADMYGPGPWDDDGMFLFMKSMHQSRTFMPPFPGTDDEARALVAYIQSIRESGERLQGAQTAGIRLPAVVAPDEPAVAQSNP